MDFIQKIRNDEKYRKHIITYLVFGIITTLVSWGSFWIMRKYIPMLNENIANIISIILAVIVAYVTNRKYVFSSNNLTIDASGGTVIQTTTGDVLNKGYLYLTKFYICNKPNISSYNYKIGNADYATPNKFNAEILVQNDSALSTSPGITGIGYSSCRLYSGLYVPNSTGNNWVSIQFTSNNTQTSKLEKHSIS